MKYSECIFKLRRTDKLFSCKDGERLYLVDILIGDEKYPGVIPEELDKQIKEDTLYRCDCYLRNEIYKDKFFTFIRILYAEEAGASATEKAVFNIEGRIQKNTGIRHIQKKEKVILLLKLKSKARDENKSLLHLILPHALALENASIKEGTLIKGNGHLHLLHGTTLEIVMDTLEKEGKV